MKYLSSISVVMCCYNSEMRLPKTLDHLAKQEGITELECEILVVNNRSTDGTASVVHRFAMSHPQLRIIVIDEEQPGAGFARQRGIAAASHEIILFVDDDNWLAPNYLIVIAETMRAHPEIGAVGGTSTAEFEVAAPSWFPRHQRWFAVNDFFSNDGLTEEEFLWTAGTAFRRRLLIRLRQLKLPVLVSGRRGSSLEAGEDDEICLQVRLAGGKLYRHPMLHFYHYLPAQRLTWDYLRRLHYAAGLVSVKLDAYRYCFTRRRFWPQWVLQCWHCQLANVCLQLLRKPILFCAAKHKQLEGDDRVLSLEVYRGRLAALLLNRNSYRQIASTADYLISAARRG